MPDLSALSDEELVSAAKTDNRARPEIMHEITTRVAAKERLSELGKPFNPRADISADARYLWKRVFIWFWLLPSAAGLVWLAAVNLK